MAYLNDRVFDSGLSVLDTEANRIDICGTEPTTFTQATVTYTLGNKTSLSIGSPQDRTGGGREVAVTAISDGSVTGNGTAAYVAITDTVNSRLLAVQALSASQAVTSGNTFSLASFTIGIPDPT
jgi:hypothetical protein